MANKKIMMDSVGAGERQPARRTIKDYRAQICKANTKEALQAISYEALKNDSECTVFSKKYDKIIQMCVAREMELEQNIVREPAGEPAGRPSLSRRIDEASARSKAPAPQTAPRDHTH